MATKGPMSSGQKDLSDAREVVAEVAPRFVQLVRESSHVGPVLGRWGVGEVACHVGHVFDVDTGALAGRPVPVTELNPAAVARMNDERLATDTERDRHVLADRIETLLGDFLAVSAAPPTEVVTWLDGIRLPASAAACHLLVELLVHGYDIATASGRGWEIDPSHAFRALAGGGVPIINAADPLAFADPVRARGFRGRMDIRIRGYERFTFVFDDGLRAEEGSGEPADVHVSADPVWMLLLMLGRVGHGRAALQGKVFLWGRRLWKVPRMLGIITPP